MILEESSLITPPSLPMPSPPRCRRAGGSRERGHPTDGLSLEDNERSLLARALEKTNGNQTQDRAPAAHHPRHPALQDEEVQSAVGGRTSVRPAAANPRNHPRHYQIMPETLTNCRSRIPFAPHRRNRKVRSFKNLQRCYEASGTEMVTVAVRTAMLVPRHENCCRIRPPRLRIRPHAQELYASVSSPAGGSGGVRRKLIRGRSGHSVTAPRFELVAHNLHRRFGGFRPHPPCPPLQIAVGRRHPTAPASSPPPLPASQREPFLGREQDSAAAMSRVLPTPLPGNPLAWSTRYLTSSRTGNRLVPPSDQARASEIARESAALISMFIPIMRELRGSSTIG